MWLKFSTIRSAANKLFTAIKRPISSRFHNASAAMTTSTTARTRPTLRMTPLPVSFALPLAPSNTRRTVNVRSPLHGGKADLPQRKSAELVQQFLHRAARILRGFRRVLLHICMHARLHR